MNKLDCELKEIIEKKYREKEEELQEIRKDITPTQSIFSGECGTLRYQLSLLMEMRILFVKYEDEILGPDHRKKY